MEKQETTIDFNEDTFYRESLNARQLFFRKLTYRDIFRKLRRYNKRDVNSVLEVGSGSGFFVRFFSERFPNSETVSIEYDHRLHEVIKQNSPRTEVHSKNAEDFDFGRKFDLIVSTHVIEHLYNPEKMVACVSQHLNKDGLLILTTPNNDGFGHLIHGDNWNGIRDDHVSLFNLPELVALVSEHGFDIQYAGSSFFSGVKLMRKVPFRFLNDLLLVLFGSLRWTRGEALMIVARKT